MFDDRPDHWHPDPERELVRRLVRKFLSILRTQALLRRDPTRCATLLVTMERCNAPITEADSALVDGERTCLTCLHRFLRTGVVVEKRDEETGETHYVSVR